MTKYSEVRKLSGWLAWQDFQIMMALISHQNSRTNSLLEIGVHHGKSFISMAQVSNRRRLYAIDIFGRQDLNVDDSGRGDKDVFVKNLERFAVDSGRVVIDERLSNDVSASDVISAVGEIDFFHIDGGHHFSAVTNDLNLARSTVADTGVVAIDDTYRPEWPEVTLAVFSNQEFLNDFKLFAIGFNKSYWCRPDCVDEYQNVLLSDAQLSSFLYKACQVDGRTTFVYQRYPLPEWKLWQRFAWYMSTHSPETYGRVKGSDLFAGLMQMSRNLRRQIRR